MGLNPLSYVRQKMGEYLVTSVLCLELFLQGSRLGRMSRTLLCPLWTLDSQGTRLPKWEQRLIAGPA